MQQKIEGFLNKKNTILLLIFPYLLIVVVSAWLSDDSYITFRTIDNFINGFGLTWNVTERVQSYTHPLWMFLLSGFYFFTKEIYFTALIVSIVISLITVYLLLKSSASIPNSALIILLLLFSKAFIDFSTSGLENPLTHLLLVLFFITYFKREDDNKKLFILSVLASLVALNRIDIVLICFPVLFISYLKVNKAKGFLIALSGFLPFIFWEVFSLFYYGFLIPNTAYAKLNTDINHLQLIQQGLHYLVFSFYLDPLTPVVIFSGLVIPFFLKDKKQSLISIGILFYLVYVIYVGGDFMGGRFLSAPFVCAVIIISKLELSKNKKFVPAIASIILLGFLSPKPPVLTSPDYGVGPRIYRAFRLGPLMAISYHGIVDERIFYYTYTGLLNNITERKLYKFPWVREALKTKNSDQKLIVKDVIGFWGYFTGCKTHIVDPLALSDALLSKLPCNKRISFDEFKPLKDKTWRIGHYLREIPEGYLETLSSGINQIKDQNLHKYYDKLSLVIKGDLWDMNRLKEILNFNFGKYNYLITNYERKKNSRFDSVTVR